MLVLHPSSVSQQKGPLRDQTRNSAVQFCLHSSSSCSPMIPFWDPEIPSPEVIHAKDTWCFWASHNGVFCHLFPVKLQLSVQSAVGIPLPPQTQRWILSLWTSVASRDIVCQGQLKPDILVCLMCCAMDPHSPRGPTVPFLHLAGEQGHSSSDPGTCLLQI